MNDDLPAVPKGDFPLPVNPSQNSGISQGTPPVNTVVPASGSGVSGKEKEIGGSPLSELHISGPGVEMELPHEVVSAGVKAQPVNVTLPPTVQSMGVSQTGASTPMTNGSSVTLPLTDREIADGLKANITSSFRWLAEWCVFQLKKLGLKKK